MPFETLPGAPAVPDDAELLSLNSGNRWIVGQGDAATVRAAADASGHSHLFVHVQGPWTQPERARQSCGLIGAAVAQGAHPLMVHWDAGVGQTLRDQLGAVGKELVFSRLGVLIAGWAARKLGLPGVGAGLAVEPDLDDSELAQLEAAIEADEELVAAATALAQYQAGAGLADPSSPVPQPLADQLRLAHRASAAGLAVSGLALVKVLAKTASRLIVAVVRRQRAAPDRPLAATISEESLRLLYADVFGGAVWAGLQAAAVDAATELGDLLEGWLSANPQRRLVLCGHGLGSETVCALLRRPWPQDGRVDVVLLGATCSLPQLEQALDAAQGAVGTTTLIGLSDTRERGYAEIPYVYPASLLYLVTGLFLDPDSPPLVGMATSWKDDSALSQRITHRLQAPDLTSGALTSDADTHRGLCTDPDTLDSLAAMLPSAAMGLTARRCNTMRKIRRADRAWSLKRRAPTWTGTDTFKAGVAGVDLTRALLYRPTGYGTFMVKPATAALGRSRATVAWLEHPEGGPVLLVFCDLHVGSRILTELIAHRLADLGLGVDRVVLAASHCHTQPGNFYGFPFYDRMTDSLFDGFDPLGATFLVDRIEKAARQAHQSRVPARIGHGSAPAWGAVWNRGVLSWLSNHEDVDAPTTLGELEARVRQHAEQRFGPVPDLSAASEDPGLYAVDPLVHALWIAAADDLDRPMGVLAVVGATPTLTPRHTTMYSGDAFGAAARHLQHVLGGQGGRPVPVNVVAGAHGDTNVVVPGMSVEQLAKARREFVDAAQARPAERPLDQRRKVTARLVRLAGQALGQSLAVAARKAATHAAAGPPGHIAVRFAEHVVPNARVEIEEIDRVGAGAPPAGTTTRMPCMWRVGESTMAASELNNEWHAPVSLRERSKRLAPGTPVRKPIVWDAQQPGAQDDWSDDDYRHSPKTRKLDVSSYTGGIIKLVDQNFVGSLVPMFGARGFDPFMPLRIVSIGDLHLTTLPLEPSVELTRQCQDVVQQALGGTVVVAGLSGGYLGYGSTIAEYAVQDYEASSSFWGRHCGPMARQRLAALAQQDPGTPGTGPTGSALFIVDNHPKVEAEEDDRRSAGALIEPDFIGLDRRALPAEVPADEPDLLRLEGAWTPRKKPRKATRNKVGRPLLANGPLLRITEAHTGQPLRVHGLPVSDVHFDFVVAWEAPQWRWYLELLLPPGLSLSGRQLNFEVVGGKDVAPRDPQWAPVQIP